MTDENEDLALQKTRVLHECVYTWQEASFVLSLILDNKGIIPARILLRLGRSRLVHFQAEQEVGESPQVNQVVLPEGGFHEEFNLSVFKWSPTNLKYKSSFISFEFRRQAVC